MPGRVGPQPPQCPRETGGSASSPARSGRRARWVAPGRGPGRSDSCYLQGWRGGGGEEEQQVPALTHRVATEGEPALANRNRLVRQRRTLFSSFPSLLLCLVAVLKLTGLSCFSGTLPFKRIRFVTCNQAAMLVAAATFANFVHFC